MKFKQLFVLVALVASLLLVACTTERDPIDKSPELALDKSLFEGEFFYRQTIVDLPYTADYSFIGESNDGKILKWKITKNWLIAYNVHDKLEVVNTTEDPTVNETPLLAYRILQHFDILPMENPVTGEDLPVYTANYDCKWNECRFIEIDKTYAGTPNFELKYMALSEQLWGAPYTRGLVTSATDFEFYAHDGSFIPPKFYSYMLKKAGDKKEDKKVESFTFKTQEQLLPINWGQFYTWADIEEFFKDEPANIWYRHTFTKVNRDVYGRRTYDAKTKSWPWKKGKIDNGFRPMQFNDEQFRMFGYFTNKFRGYNPDHGNKWEDVYILADYFNIGWGRLKKGASFTDGITAGENIEWNFTCKKASDDIVKSYNDCLKDVVVQQKIVFTSSAETPKRMIAPNCAMAKDYNHALLAARFAAMNPGSDTRDFEKWYNSAYADIDFFKEYKTGSTTTKVRDDGWYTHTGDYDGWEDKCFIVPTEQAHVQKWNGDVIEDKYTNEIGAFVRNPVEGFIAARDGNHLSRYENYDGFAATGEDVEDDTNAVRICVPKADAEGADEYVALKYFENCLTNDTQMTKVYTEEYGRDKWKGDRWDCRVLEQGETCDKVAKNEAVGSQKEIASWVEVKAACVLDNERNCRTYGTDTVRPMLRHKFMNGDMTVAMWNWVDQPTEYGILGVSQWNINPETGQSFGAGSNIAGSVLAWAVNRGVEMSRMLVSSDGDPAAWDWEDLIHPEYEDMPSNIWDNNPQDARKSTSSNVQTRSIVQTGSDELEGDADMKKLDLIQMPKYQNRFDFASVKGTEWESKMLPYSMLKAMFPWSDPTSYNYSADMKEQLSHMFIPEQTEIEMQRLIQRGKNTYFEASFLDGAIIQFLQERQAIYRAKYPDWKTSQKEAYTQAFLGAVADDLEILLYKGVAEHEMGHSVGLRHNFVASTDMMNYKDGYFAPENYPNLMKEEGKLVKKLTDEGVDPGAIGDEVYALKRAYPYAPERDSDGKYQLLPGASEDVTPIEYSMYVSIMDYQSEPYIHAVGLGKYDYAALKFVYGRSVEQMDFDSQGFVKMSTDNPVRDARYPLPVLKNITYIKDNGELKTLADMDDPRTTAKGLQPSKLERYYDGDVLKWRVVVDVTQDNSTGKPLTDKETGQYVTNFPDRYLINDGSVYPYKFFSDETRMDEPASNVWDTGYLATDVIRSFRYMDDKYYYLRYFERGNPRFREFRGRKSMKMIYDTIFRNYKYVHFLLDLNYNMFQTGWLFDIPRSYGDSCEGGSGNRLERTRVIDLNDPTTDEPVVHNTFCEEYSRAIDGQEYWFDTDGNFREYTPMEGGDYLAAGALGVNYLLADVVYRPDSGSDYLNMLREDQNFKENKYLMADKIEPSQNGYWKVSQYVGLPASYLMQVDASIGRYQKDHWDKQDDPAIYYDKVTRRGYSEQKMVALYTLTNSGWFSGKYRRESMANSIGGNAPGFQNTKFLMMAEVANEDDLFGLSPYCVYNKKVQKVKIPNQIIMNLFGSAPFVSGTAKKLPNNLCAYYGMATAKDIAVEDKTAPVADRQALIVSNMLKRVKNAGRYEPINAGWTYYDKTWPLYWGMGNIANISADTSIFWKFMTLTYAPIERDLYPEPGVDEVEVLNSQGTRYYRAKLSLIDLSEEDRVALANWKAVKAAGGTDEEALCQHKFAADGTTDLGCLHYCTTEATDDDGHVIIDQYGFIEYTQDVTCTEGIVLTSPNMQEMLNKYNFYATNGYGDNVPADISDLIPSEETFTYYLRSTYARFSPSFKLVWSLKRYNTNDNGMVTSDPEAQPVTIMETTLDSMNAWALSNMGFAVQMAYY